jgi:UMF1 family MFS transporter
VGSYPAFSPLPFLADLGGVFSVPLPREVWAWAMYDFANSGYTTVVITAVFNAYFVAVVAQRAPWATLAWTATLAVSYAAVIVRSPRR